MIWPQQPNSIYKEIGSGGATMLKWICPGNPLLAMLRPLISFCIQSSFDIPCPCPSNLFRWKLSAGSLYTLCKTLFATVSHILSGCKVALKQGRYTYRHDNILVGIVKCLQDFLATHSPSLPSEDDTIHFV